MRYKIRHFKKLTSTNDYALELARKGSAEGIVARADYQTDGRGRGNSRWVSPPGQNLLFSILLRPPIKASRAPMLTQVAASAVKKALGPYVPHARVRIKKPNDVLLNGRKVCGILVESRSNREKLEYVVIGIGVNVNSRIRNLVAGSTSIYREKGRKIEKSRLFLRILSNFKDNYENFLVKMA